MNRGNRPTLMQTQMDLSRRIIISVVVMTALIALVYLFNIPNPNMILIVGLVSCSALFGFGGGVVAAVIMLFYTLFFFSTDHSFIHFTPQNLQKVFVSLVGVVADTLLVCLLKQEEILAFRKVENLTEALHLENSKLQHMSLTDALTGIRNRLALRQDYESYQDHDVMVMMVDLNDFKLINDTHGHEEGDRVLRETGRLLADTFGEEHCYRYGGDEFLVIVRDMPEAEFREKLEAMQSRRPMIGDEAVEFSVGYVEGQLDAPDRLRNLIANADERMYQVKRDKKHEREARGHARLQAREYSVGEMKSILGELSDQYALARVVDPNECRVLELGDDGRIRLNESCYGIWNAEQKCLNCSSAMACRTGCHQMKREQFDDKVYSIQSNPISLRLADGGVYQAVVELATIEQEYGREANDRAEENIGNRAAHYQASHDSLTSVLNADAFYELARERIHQGREEAWVMVTGNIMNFRLVNTLFGVNRGNEVLARTAEALRDISEAADGLCGRLGGDHFGLLLPKRLYQEAALQNVGQALAESFNSGIYIFCIHFGVYEIDDIDLPVSVMCGRANSALRTIRDSLTQIIAYFNDDIRQKLLKDQQVISGFEEALKTGQFQMYLQPIVREDGTVIGGEALTRWRRPDGSFVMPGDFIETLENAGLIHRLDVYIWECAVRQLSLWKGTAREKLWISVNMSAKDFYSIDVYDMLVGLLDKYGVEARMLRLEITETALLVEPDKSDAVVSRLRDRGFLVEIDDFGRGYSSLSMLKDIQADVLKIDMSFLSEILESTRSCIILESVISLAESLGMEVITEGVETQQQLNTLTAMDCSRFQGYYFSKPVPVEVFEAKC